jgi:hypothetical protein
MSDGRPDTRKLPSLCLLRGVDRARYGADRSSLSFKELFMVQPGYSGQPQQVDNNMTMSIVSIFLFWPLAIPAIINASKVNPLLQSGDYNGAVAAATESKKWSKLALIIGLVLWGISIVCCIGYFIILGSVAANA